MRSFSNIDDMWADVLTELALKGNALDSRAGDSVEIIGYQARLTGLDKTFILNPRRALSVTYAMAEMLWYLSGSCIIDALLPYAPQYVRFAEGNRAFGSYGYRWTSDPAYLAESQGSYSSQLEAVTHLLRSKPNTRQAVITMWNAGDLPHAILGDHKDLPCTLTWQFLRRDDGLHLITTMRSNDVWLGFPYDVFVNTTILRLVAMALNVAPVSYTHQVGSMHLYTRNTRAALEAISPRAMSATRAVSNLRHLEPPPHPNLGWSHEHHSDVFVAAAAAVAFEHEMRTQKPEFHDWYKRVVSTLGRTSPLYDAVLACAAKFTDIRADLFSSPLLREAFVRTR